MAENEPQVAPEAPKKRKRKTELEKLIQGDTLAADASSADTDENPWTPRENLELLRTHRDYHSVGNAKQKAARLHDMMSRIRRTAFQPEKAARTDKEFMSQVRQLKNEGVKIEELEAEVFPEEAPRKKKKRIVK